MRAYVRIILAAIALGAAATPASALFDLFDTVPSVKGNDTGGIIAYGLYQQGADVKTIAVDHCARYGKVVKLTGVQQEYGGYISFECIWVPPGHVQRPLNAAY